MKIEDGDDLEKLQSQAKDMSGILVMDATDWQVIPPVLLFENIHEK